MDLEDTISLIERPMGIFAMLEEECIVPKATDQTLVLFFKSLKSSDQIPQTIAAKIYTVRMIYTISIVFLPYLYRLLEDRQKLTQDWRNDIRDKCQIVAEVARFSV